MLSHERDHGVALPLLAPWESLTESLTKLRVCNYLYLERINLWCVSTLPSHYSQHIRDMPWGCSSSLAWLWAKCSRRSAIREGREERGCEMLLFVWYLEPRCSWRSQLTIWVVARCSKNASWNLKRTSSLIQVSALGSSQLVCMVKLTQTALFLEIENKHKQKMQGLNPTSGLLARTIFIPIGVVRLPLPGALTHLLYVRFGTWTWENSVG